MRPVFDPSTVHHLKHKGAVDADGHVLEDAGLWDHYIEARYRDRALRLKRDSEVETMARHKPPPPPSQPPPPSKMKIVSDAGAAQTGLSGLEIPNLNLKADLGGSLMGGSKGNAAAAFDGDIIPLQCPPTTYPSDARRAGLNGWVQIELVVAPDGSVRSARAIDAQPKGVFEAAAVMTAQRCRFKPKMVDGKPVEQRGKRKWNFNLNTNTAE